ncbi:hypothetical protein [Sphingomonas sp. Leaf343]|uniref:hypothetical protein n=1 Tax=Sphingomonas sp. Leaf343 TaxID=1736345 RepID=UPI0006FAA7DA|nr:hypothetical protein [Sphingomonas sp. Leaf343]KQR81205.1 hypothetical protein ASG07_12110 [Sphingomonas sp. Leaf343]
MTDPASPPPLAPSRRHDGWSVDRQNMFLTHLARFGGASAAARAVRMSTKSAYRLRDRSPAFAEAWAAAQDEGVMRSFDQAMDRAMNGHLVPVYREGHIIGVRRRYDNRLLYAACYAQPPRE